MKFSSKAFSAAAITFAMIIGASSSDAAVLGLGPIKGLGFTEG